MLPAVTCVAPNAPIPAIISTIGQIYATPKLQRLAKVSKNHILSAVSTLLLN
jgi:hypothetical protein